MASMTLDVLWRPNNSSLRNYYYGRSLISHVVSAPKSHTMVHSEEKESVLHIWIVGVTMDGPSEKYTVRVNDNTIFDGKTKIN